MSQLFNLTLLAAICGFCNFAQAQQVSPATATSVAPSPEQEAIDQAKHAVSYDMKDPDSAKFRHVRGALRGVKFMVCGEVNAKNSYGAYTGFKPFLRWGDTLTIANETIDPVSNRALLNTTLSLCSNTLDQMSPPPVPDAKASP